ncbi:AMED_5909 family protein [Actinokineospora diospyrosa]|uniref:Uncharacterized protein n=1 Tax=Actinokineospora diospyrosa TaxID=103728 RepID=A0ABT1IFI2_9PSEU|nr:AMED_5909 family protein [Actinokineospora diospyrosa]MCP2271404.1 hypothetical protein [Actinokineospora diospyrosa]
MSGIIIGNVTVHTLSGAHAELVAIRPTPTASEAEWRSYYRRSATVYRNLVDVDTGHKFELMYWFEREAEKANRPDTEVPKDQVDVFPYNKRILRLRTLSSLLRDVQSCSPGVGATISERSRYFVVCARLSEVVAELDRRNHHLARAYASGFREAVKKLESGATMASAQSE